MCNEEVLETFRVLLLRGLKVWEFFQNLDSCLGLGGCDFGLTMKIKQ
jgi:hypothetical protein